MYKILVISDTHKRMGPVIDLVDRITDLNHIIHLGDVIKDAMDLEAIYDVPVDYVAGNCDYAPTEPRKKVIDILGKKFFITHGHLYGVKNSTETLREIARDNNYDVILFGHSHIPLLKYEGETIIMNPGSLSEPRNFSKPSFGIIQIDHKAKLHAGLHEK